MTHLLKYSGNTQIVVDGTGQKLYQVLNAVHLTGSGYMVISCCLHNLQTVLRNGVQMVLGEGGLDDDKNGKLNAIQLLHGVYDIQNWYKHDELKDMYLFTRREEGNEEQFKKMKEPILTQW